MAESTASTLQQYEHLGCQLPCKFQQRDPARHRIQTLAQGGSRGHVQPSASDHFPHLVQIRAHYALGHQKY